MPPDSRKLLGTYRTPRFRYGAKVQCEARGEVRIVGLSRGRIPWPLARSEAGGLSLVVYRDLARAVRKETNRAVAHHWGVATCTVGKWRKALAVPHENEGTTRWRIAFGKSPGMKKAVKAMAATAQRPERRAKIAATMRGKARPQHVVEGMRRRMLGNKQSEASLAKRSATNRTRGIRPPWLNPGWSEAENELLRTLPAKEVAKRTGRTMRAVYVQRCRLGINDGRKNNRVLNPAQVRLAKLKRDSFPRVHCQQDGG